jgi:VanZ family protein
VDADRAARVCLILGFWIPLAVVSWLAFTPSPPEAVSRVSDVILHAMAFTYLTFALGLAHDQRPLRIAVLMLGYGVLIEVVQSLIPERSAELKDVLVDAAGIVVGIVALRLLGDWTRRTLTAVLAKALPRN